MQAYFNKVYGYTEAFETLYKSGDSASTPFVSGSSNLIVFRGCTKYWDRQDEDYTATVGGQGYLPDSWMGKGLKALLNGALEAAPEVTHKYMIKS